VAGASVDLATYRRLARILVLGSVAGTVAGIYGLLRGSWFLGGAALAAGIVLLWFVQRLSIAAEAGSEDTLVFVTKDDCALCDEAKALLPSVTDGLPFRVEEARLESSRFLRRHFRSTVPVLLWQGEEIARLGWDAEALRRRLEAIVAARPPAAGRQSP